MRIGIDATSLPSSPVGAGVYIIQLVRALVNLETEHEFVVFAHQSGRKLINIPSAQNLEWVEVLDKSPAIRLLWEQMMLPILVRHSGVDILHSLHYTRPLALLCTSVVTFHDMTFFLFPELHTRSKRLLFPASIRSSARLADALIAVSESTRRDSIRLLDIPPQKIFTVSNGIGEEFHPISDKVLLETTRRQYKLPEAFILYVGLLEPRKNLPLLLKAYANLNQSFIPPPLVIVGRMGWMVEDISRQVEALDLKDKVIFTGYIPSQDLPIVYNLAQLFVYPSIYEGFGFPPLEAMACGIPVITTAVSAMLDQIGDGGVLVPPQDEQALSQAMCTILNDSALRQELSHEGIRQAANFTWKNAAQATINVYQHVRQAR